MALSARSEPEIGVAQVVQDLGDAGHAGAADADEVDVLDGVFHALSTSRFDLVGHARRGARPAPARAPCSAIASSVARGPGRAAASASRCGVSSRCGRAAPRRLRQELRVVALVDVVLTISGTSTRGDAGGAQLADRAGAGAADHQVAVGQALRPCRR